jgi:SAM-dependent methyltransferase
VSPIRSARTLVPFLVSLAAIAYLVATVDLRSMLSHMDSRAVLVLIPALLVYGALSLLIEAMTLVRLVPDGAKDFDVWKASRVKAASYLMNLIHYALGAGALALLLRRRAGIGVAEAAGVVILIAVFDLGMLLLVLAIGLMNAGVPDLRVALAPALIGALFAGFALLRAPLPLGPLEGLRSHRLFAAARTTPAERLLDAAALRLLFVLCFLGLGWAGFSAFRVAIPLDDFLVNFPLVAAAGILPSVAGIGPAHVGVVELFGRFSDRETLLACSLGLSAGMILLRLGIGLLFAREYAREVYAASRATEAEPRAELEPALTFTGDPRRRLLPVDLARHRAPYAYAIGLAGRGRALDLGCGGGYGTADLADALPRVVGVDRIPPDRGSRKRNIGWVRADLRSLPLRARCFETIVSFQVIEHLEDPAILIEAIARLLEPDGVALMTTPNLLTSDRINPYHVHEYQAEELRGHLLPRFAEVEMLGVRASERVSPYESGSADPPDHAHDLSPAAPPLPRLVAWLFAKGARWVRRRIRPGDGCLAEAGPSDFPIGPADPGDLDLLAVCRGPR